MRLTRGALPVVAKRKKKVPSKPAPKRRRPQAALVVCGALTLAVAMNIAMRPEHRPNPVAASDAPAADEAAALDRQLLTAIQEQLEVQGYGPGKAAGELTLETRAAILAYETDIGEPLTGLPNEGTLKALLFGTTIVAMGLAPPKVTPEGRAVIREIETRLTRAGYDPGAVDGKLDEKLAKAIKKLETAEGLKPTGRIRAEVVRRLAAVEG